MTLNAQERAAVEAAKAWFIDRQDPEAQRVHFGLPGTSERSDYWLRHSYALGHLSGFRAGVEAAIRALDERMEREEYGHAKAAVALDIAALGALLAQEDEHGS